MERNINVAEILKSKSKGTKLYSAVFGQMIYIGIVYDTNGTEIWLLTEKNRVDTLYLSDGKYREGGEVTLYPSKEMRDWSKFAWKKGDVLVSNDYGTEVIFDKWYDDTYTSFYCKHYLNSEDETKFVYYEEFICTTERYAIEDKDKAQIYIGIIEERLGGKLNLKTLEIEKKPKFNDGDILYAERDKSHIDAIFILKTVKEERGYYACLILHPYMVCKYSCGGIGNKTLRYATEKEKQQLFDALAKEGKVWDANKKQIVDLKPKWITLKPFDKVLVRDGNDEIWEPAFFFRNRPELNVYKYQTVGGKLRVYCIPFNEETSKLIGTTNNWEG